MRAGGLRGRLGEWLKIERGELIWLAAIVVGALAVRVVWVLAMQVPLFADPYNHDILAQRIVSGEGYVNADGDPTAFWPVGYPAFLALVYLVFGHSITAGGVANALIGAVSAALAYALSRQSLSRSGLADSRRSRRVHSEPHHFVDRDIAERGSVHGVGSAGAHRGDAVHA